MKFMVVDLGESRVKILATGQETLREFASGPSLTAEEIVSGVLDAAGGWNSRLLADHHLMEPGETH
jgi:polyphosphate glucokinase